MSSESESDVEDTIIDSKPQIPGPTSERRNSTEILIIDDDDNENGETSNGLGTETANGVRRSRSARLRPSVVNYAEYFSDEEEEDKVKKSKLEKEIINNTKEIEFLPDSISELSMNGRLAKSYQNLKFKSSDTLNMNDYIALFQLCGKFVQRISIEKVNIELLKQINTLCVNLKTLVIRKSTQDEKFIPSRSQNSPENVSIREFTFHDRFQELCLFPNNFTTNNPRQFKTFILACKNIESFHYNFSTLADLHQMLMIVKSTNFKNLKSLTISQLKEHADEETIGLQKEHIKLIGNLGLKQLQTLHLKCGLWENVLKEEFEDLMNSYANLESFTLAGNYCGTDNIHMSFSIEIPKMNKLNSISIGSVYEFEPVDQFLSGQNSNIRETGSTPSDSNEPILLSEKSLISIKVSFPHIMPKLNKLIMGNLFQLDQLHPQTFPNLSVFRVGSSWSTSIEIPMNSASNANQRKFPIFPSMRELQLPDFIRDEYFVEQINKIFPNLRKVWINLPSSKCLRLFLKTMAGSSLKELYIKTQYDFNGILESALLSLRIQNQSQDYRHSQPSSSRSVPKQTNKHKALQLLLKYQNSEISNDQYYNDFINYYNIELPTDDELDPVGVSLLKKLKVLQLVHIPRKLKIPLNNKLPHYHRDQRFHPKTYVGFNQYPLHALFFKEEIPLMLNLEKFHHEKIKVPVSYILPTMVKFSGRSSYRSDKDTRVFDISDDEDNWIDKFGNTETTSTTSPRSKKLKVKIPPSLAATQQFRVKKEQRLDLLENPAPNAGLEWNLLWNVQIPLKIEKQSN